MLGDFVIVIDNDITDPLISGRENQVSETFRNAKQIIENGGKVIAKHRCAHEEPRTISVFTLVEDLDIWKELLNETQKFLSRGLIK